MSGREINMDSEKKVTVCVKDYGMIAEDQLKARKRSEDWRVITDGDLFHRSIFCSIVDGEEWMLREDPIIREILDKYIWEIDLEEGVYIIEQRIKSLDEEVGKEALYLRLAYIALLGDRTKKDFIKAIVDIAYYKKTDKSVDADILKFLYAKTGEGWKEPLKSIFKEHFGDKGKYMVVLEELYRNNCNYIKNMKSRIDFDNS